MHTNTLKDQLKAAKRALQQQRRDNKKAKAAALERVERDEWRSFKADCIQRGCQRLDIVGR